MKRLMTVLVAAALGAALGYATKQALERRKDPAEDQPLVIAVPAWNAMIAAAVGLISGRRARKVAFTSGFVISAIAGADLERVIKGRLGLNEPAPPTSDED